MCLNVTRFVNVLSEWKIQIKGLTFNLVFTVDANSLNFM